MPTTSRARKYASPIITCLAWTPEGELCGEDWLLLLGRLMQIDPCLAEGR
jgi:hypothetical protein